MAKLAASSIAYTRRDVVRARGRFQIKNWKGEAYASSWPKRRGKAKSARQQAWIDHFKCVATALKSPPPEILDAGTAFAAGTGWYYRDLQEVAAVAKLIRYRDEVRVTTPTVFAKRTTAENQSGSSPYTLTPNAVDWDNNQFWNGSVNPSRLTWRSPGLYLVGMECQFPNGTNGQPVVLIYKNGTTILCRQYIGPSGNFQTLQCMTVAYFHAGDYIQAKVDVSGSGHNFLLNALWAVAITPEAIVP